MLVFLSGVNLPKTITSVNYLTRIAKVLCRIAADEASKDTQKNLKPEDCKGFRNL